MAKTKIYKKGLVYFPKDCQPIFDNLTPREISNIILKGEDIFAKFSIDEIVILIEKGKRLFELMDLTKEAENYLSYIPDLKEVVEKWQI